MFERKSSRPEAGPAPGTDSATPAAPVQAKAPIQTAGQTAGSEVRAMIGSKVKVTGDIESAEDLLIEGEVSGTVTLAENELVIGNSGRVHADIEAKTIRIEGEVQGDITGRERVVITASGNVQGNVSAPRVMLEDGGRFKGSIDMGGSRAAAASAPTASPGSSPGAKASSAEASSAGTSSAEAAAQAKAGVAGVEKAG
jgi:cytoskeletal protein CcmA (bactofilin family)